MRLFLHTILLCLLMPVASAADTTRQRLTLYTWKDYIAPAIVQRFERETGSDVILQHFEEADEREEVLARNQAQGLDLVCIGENHLTQPGLQDWMEPLDRTRLPTLRHVQYPMADEIPEAPRYAVPYFWGTFGIAYRSDMVKQPPRSWRALFEQSPQYSGKVAMYPTVRILAGVALLASGADFNSEDPAQIDAAGRILLQQADHVWGYRGVDLTDRNLLANGTLAIQPLFNGDALFLRQYQPAIEFVYPAEGANVFVDYFVIPRHAANKTLAYRFLDFLNQPEVALQNALYVKFATPNQAARAIAPEDYRNNPLIFPSPEILARAHIIRPLTPAALRRYTDIVMRATIRFEQQHGGE